MTIRRRVVWRSGIRIWLVRQKLIKEFFVQAGCIEGIAATPMWQRQPGGRADIGLGDLMAALPCGMRGGGPRGHNVGAHAVDLERATHPGNGRQLPITEMYRREQRPRPSDLDAQRLFLGRVCGDKRGRVTVERHPATDHVCSLLGIPRGRDLDRQSETVQQLGS
jgi:hypothetical protein